MYCRQANHQFLNPLLYPAVDNGCCLNYMRFVERQYDILGMSFTAKDLKKAIEIGLGALRCHVCIFVEPHIPSHSVPKP